MAEENVPHLFLECPLVRLLWRRLKEATGISDHFDTLDGLWEAGRRRTLSIIYMTLEIEGENTEGKTGFPMNNYI
ncbi:hypothetical protein QJS10_CPB17g00891 [Acorus calamus]|uniref:Uncharacterized protein n=1 Tax=Acorus calamus TaxID=4465 RepID=A0AAV9CVQ2_ACOCL|nr:hypothetical protein QJS10_CPB17g00891 [Acorus calamus]